MKIRDIKNNLKNEHDEKSVPDVFSRAKKAPINRLLTGEEPLRAFDKTTAVRLLWIALALLLVCALAFSALALMQDNKPAPSQSYVRLSVESEGKTIVYGFVISDESVTVCTLERDGENTPFSNVGKQGENIKYAINEVYRVKNDDKVRVCVIGEDRSTALRLATALVSAIRDGMQSGVEAEVSYAVNDASVTSELIALLSLEQNATADQIAKTYFEKFA